MKAVELVTTGRVEALMKGSLHTDELMGAVVSQRLASCAVAVMVAAARRQSTSAAIR